MKWIGGLEKGVTLISKTQQYSYSTGSYIRGRWEEDPATAGTFEGSIQPLSFKDMQSTAVGREDRGKVKIYTKTQLPVGEEDSNISGAIVEWQGKKWEVIQEIVYAMGILPHNKYIAELRGKV